MKSQIDIATAIGSIIIPTAALFGALIFAFQLLGPLTDAARLAAVISHDVITLSDVAYSVPDNIIIYYKPPTMCQFIDVENPNSGCNPKDCTTLDETSCSNAPNCGFNDGSCKLCGFNQTDCKSNQNCTWYGCVSNCSMYYSQSECDSLNHCKWDKECRDKCYGKSETDCDYDADCFWNGSECKYLCSSMDDNKTKCQQTSTCVWKGCKPKNDAVVSNPFCLTYNKDDCSADTTCYWVEPHKTKLVCLNGFMNMSIFRIYKKEVDAKLISKDVSFGATAEDLLESKRKFLLFTKVEIPAYLPREDFKNPLTIDYTGHGNLLDYGIDNYVDAPIENESIKIQKIRTIYDTLETSSIKMDNDPLYSIVSAAFYACTLKNNQIYFVQLPRLYHIGNIGSKILLKRCIPPIHNVEEYALQCRDVYSFDISKLNTSDCIYNINSFSITARSPIIVKVNATVECACPEGCEPLSSDTACSSDSTDTCPAGKYCCNSQCVDYPQYNVTLNITQEGGGFG